MSHLIRITGILLAAACVAFLSTIVPLVAQEPEPPLEAADAPLADDQQALIEDPLGSELVQVDWLEEMFEGGVTMVALGILSVALVAFLIERFFTLRRRNFLAPGLLTTVRPLFGQGRFDEILAACAAQPSLAADIVRHCVEFRAASFDIVQTGAADIAGRAVVDQEEKCNPLTVIAGVAPLLGLLGTMIGMIEAFKLVEVFGDEGGASLLAGSISKALITTAVGLILAIPAVLGYHWARRRVHGIANTVEVETESLLKLWFLQDKRAEGGADAPDRAAA